MDKKPRILVFCAILLLISGCKTDRPGTLKWKFKTGGTMMSSPVICGDGTVCFGSNDGLIHALNPDGTLKWTYQTQNTMPMLSVGDDGTIFAGYGGYVYALSSSGELKWKYKIDNLSQPVINADGSVCVVSYCSIYVFNPEDGSIISQIDAGRSFTPDCVPALDDEGTVYVGFIEGPFCAIDTTGQLKWEFEDVSRSTLRTWWCHPAIDQNGTVYVGVASGYYYAVSPDGTLKWKLGKGFVQDISPVIGPEGTVYLLSDNDEISAVNQDGSLEWKYEDESCIFNETSPVVGSDGVIYIQERDCLIALNSDGSLSWKFRNRTNNDRRYAKTSSPAIGDDGTIYFGGGDGYFYAVNSRSEGLASSPWPRYAHDNQNTGRAGGGN